MRKYEMVEVERLVPYEKNAKKHPDEQVKQIAKSIEEFGFINPVLIDGDYGIIAGHGRVLGAKMLGMTEVPCLFVEDLSEAQKKAYIIADNKLVENAEWDLDILKQELEELEELDFDIELTGFTMEELELDIEVLPDGEVQEDDFDGEPPAEPNAKLGDIYQLGRHRLMCGDSTNINDVEKLMGGQKADMVFTDPPYNLQTEGGCNDEIGKALKLQGKGIEFISKFDPTEFLNVLPSVFNGNMNAYIFCNKELLPQYLNWAVDNKYSYNVLVWKKPSAIPIRDSHRPDIEYMLLFRKNAIWNYGLNGVNYSRCIECSREKRTDQNGKHPTIKPLELIANEVQISSNRGSSIVDLFGGSGSTLIACEQLNRTCYMMELDPKYVDVIIARWEKLTGKKAELIEQKDEYLEN